MMSLQSMSTWEGRCPPPQKMTTSKNFVWSSNISAMSVGVLITSPTRPHNTFPTVSKTEVDDTATMIQLPSSTKNAGSQSGTVHAHAQMLWKPASLFNHSRNVLQLPHVTQGQYIGNQLTTKPLVSCNAP